MKIVIMRHGQADMFVEAGLEQTDANRALTSQGKVDSHKMAQEYIKAQGARIDLVLVSPYLRAQQTWQSIESLFDFGEMQTCDDITPYGKAPRVVDYVSAIVQTHQSPQKSPIDSVLLISHLPLVSYLTAEFATGISPPPFNTSSIACVEFDVEKQQGDLVALYQNR